MNPFFKQFHTASRDVRLTHAERRHIHARVMEAIQASEQPVLSPYVRSSFFMRAAAAAFVLVLIVGVSGGTAFAAENALPGDLLYPVKVSVNEPVEVALAATPAARANVNASIAAERLSEAETLASQGRLSDSASSALAMNFNAHASAAHAAVAELAMTDPDSATLLSADFSDLVAEKGTAILSASSEKNPAVKRASGTFVLAAVTRGTDTVTATAAVPASAPSPTLMSASAKMAPSSSATVTADRAHRAHAAVSALTNRSGSTTTLAEKTHAAALANLMVKADAESALGSTTQADDDYDSVIDSASAEGPHGN